MGKGALDAILSQINKKIGDQFDTMDQGRTFCFDAIISATIFARRKSAGGNMIGLNQQRKSHVSSRSFGR